MTEQEVWSLLDRMLKHQLSHPAGSRGSRYWCEHWLRLEKLWKATREAK